MKVDSNSNEWFATQGEEYVIELQNGKYSGPLVELADGVVFGSMPDVYTLRRDIFGIPVPEDELYICGGFVFYMPEGVVSDKTVVIRDCYSESGKKYNDHVFFIGHGASLRLFYELGAESGCMVERAMRFNVETGAKLDHSQFVHNGAGSQVILGSTLCNLEDSRTIFTAVAAGDGDVRLHCDADMSGRRADVDCSILYLCNNDEKIDVDIKANHTTPDCRSNVLVKGIAGGNSEGRFNGLVHVSREAQHTEAYQQSRNILLSESARIVSTPQLKIFADDVRCSHGATVGRQDGDQIYYMRQRGIPQEQARRLMLAGFMNEVLDRLPEGLHREAVLRKVDEKLEGME